MDGIVYLARYANQPRSEILDMSISEYRAWNRAVTRWLVRENPPRSV